MVVNDAPGAWPIWTPWTQLAGFMKGITKHFYTQNIKALGFMVSEKKIFYVFPIIALCEISVTMETRVPILSGAKPIATFAPPQ